ALVGPNGAGKTTLLNTVCGLLAAAAGGCAVRGRVAQVPEGRQLFADMTVEDNLRLGAWTVRDRDPARIYDLFPPLPAMRRRPARWWPTGGARPTGGGARGRGGPAAGRASPPCPRRSPPCAGAWRERCPAASSRWWRWAGR